MSVTRTDEDLEAIYKAQNGTSHPAALRSLYQLGRADEAAAHRDHTEHLKTANANLQAAAAKRLIQNPGAPLVGDGSDPDDSATTVGSPTAQEPPRPTPASEPETVTKYSDDGEIQVPAPASRKPIQTKGTKANVPNTPNPGTDPPGLEHPAANSG